MDKEQSAECSVGAVAAVEAAVWLKLGLSVSPGLNEALDELAHPQHFHLGMVEIKRAE